MERLTRYLKGDLALWGVVLFFAALSFLPVYSASSNLVYLEKTGITTYGYFARHAMLISVGLLIIFLVHRFPYRFFRPLSRLGLLVSWILLFFVLLKGNTIEGANANRWIYIFGVSFQPSALAMIILLMYVASYLADIYGEKINFNESLFALWIPVGITVAMVTVPNFSTGAIMFFMVLLLLYIGRYPLKYIFSILVMSILLFGVFLLFIRAYPDAFSHRADTWKSRIETFLDKDKEENYQSQRAKMAIVSGGFWGQGAGKSVMKNLLPQGSSDFIFAIVVEEYGLWGGAGLIFLFIIMLVRFVVISLKATTIFGKLLVLGVGIPIVFQGFVNMGVSVGLLPVTGQNLPFFTSGGTSIWMTCLALGIILSVSAKQDKNSEKLKMKEQAQTIEDSSPDGEPSQEELSQEQE
ncbi:FtsW/RodA/SpoVE family cell cycle protein [Capnocytophaga sp. G2]|uniref:FtsW/RodA/SpoVE family cell cycle protein n=1 Tax=Capnocytophaga sp. G2 TaxID=3110695 RepID=UPI002B47C966|nr:FtsW/RodA/SpoVE family cell cycle protein [Capnocytophaga sp. G2]MEB3005123.1 FtsW/RodA/SpoVE family cell cycle protein [Capnocytophaga sp. G2]